MIDTSPTRMRTIAVISARTGRSRQGSQLVSTFLRKSGYDVISVTPAQTPIDLTSLVPVGISPGSVDAVVIFRRPDAMPVQIREVADEQEFTAVWLPPGTWRCAAGADAQQHHLVFVMM